MMKNDAAIRVQALHVVRGGRTVVDRVSFDLAPGTLTGLLGPSGCGKTTLMRAIVGVQIVAGGDVQVLGSPAGSAPLRAKVGYVTQDPSVYQDLTVTENLRYFASLLSAPPGDVQRVIGEVGLASHADVLAGQLSGGQIARVSLATALLNKPQVLVLDEPTVGLDPVLRRDLWTLFRGLADAGVTMLVSSHVMDEAQRCERLLLMREGVILADESPAALLARTGCKDVEEAFLQLVDEQDARAAQREVTA